MLKHTQEGLRSSRALGLQASKALLDSRSALASGVLIGLCDALQPSKAKKG